MPDREPLPPGILPNVFDTDPPPMHPATVVHDAYIGVDASKCSMDELVEVRARHPLPNIYTPEALPGAEELAAKLRDGMERHAAHGRHPMQEPTGRH